MQSWWETLGLTVFRVKLKLTCCSNSSISIQPQFVTDFNHFLLRSNIVEFQVSWCSCEFKICVLLLLCGKDRKIYLQSETQFVAVANALLNWIRVRDFRCKLKLNSMINIYLFISSDLCRVKEEGGGVRLQLQHALQAKYKSYCFKMSLEILHWEIYWLVM